jgi:hypothetical protein
MSLFPRSLKFGIALASAVALAQCSQSPLASPTSPTAGASAGGTRLDSGAPGDPGDGVPSVEYLQVCKTADSNVAGTFTLTTDVPGTIATPITVQPGRCVIGALSGAGANVSVTETSAGFVSGQVLKIEIVNGSPVNTTSSFTNGSSFLVKGNLGYVILVKNRIEDPPGGGQGCTPGYWRQDHHYDSWTGYTPGQDFDTAFGVNFFNPNITLGAAVALGGGGVNALARHGVAALLNAASNGVAYNYTTAQVIAIVRGTGAYAGLSVESRKDLLAAANEAGCPLN